MWWLLPEHTAPIIKKLLPQRAVEMSSSLSEAHVSNPSHSAVVLDGTSKETGGKHGEHCFSNRNSSITTCPVEEDKNICWICLDTDTPERPLEQPCKCPRYCHLRCLARWQLQSAGTKCGAQSASTSIYANLCSAGVNLCAIFAIVACQIGVKLCLSRVMSMHQLS